MQSNNNINAIIISEFLCFTTSDDIGSKVIHTAMIKMIMKVT